MGLMLRSAAIFALTAAPALAAGGGEKKGGMPQLNFDTWGSQIFWLVVSLVVLFIIMKHFTISICGSQCRIFIHQETWFTKNVHNHKTTSFFRKIHFIPYEFTWPRFCSLRKNNGILSQIQWSTGSRYNSCSNCMRMTLFG